MYNRGMKSKVLENKRIKKEKLLQAAFLLLTKRDIQDISIQDIASEAGVGKGTFYLYFKDKFEIRNILIAMQAKKLFDEANQSLALQSLDSFEDSIIFVIEHVLDHLDSIHLKFIQKNLSFGVFHNYLQTNYETDSFESIENFKLLMKRFGYSYKNPEVTLYMILELVSSSCYESIMHGFPLPIEEFKPYLFDTIRTILSTGKEKRS